MFGISVSGIKGSQKHLDVTSNNIANVNTYGFKKSRAEFGDMYANSIFVNSKTSAGMGVQNTVVSQQFVQGALSGDTGNALDMAIQGNGFFVLSAAGSNAHTYTRNGAFQVDNQGYIVTATGEYLQGWNVNEDGSTTSLDLNATHNIQIPSDTGAPHESNNIGIGVNLPADKDAVDRNANVTFDDADPGNPNYDGLTWNGQEINDISENDFLYGRYIKSDGTAATQDDPGAIRQYFTNFDPNDSSTYTSTTSQVIHDSLGRAHTLTYYMLKMGPESAANQNNTTWVVIPYVDGSPVDVAANGNDMPTMISVPSDAQSDIAGSNLFGFRVTFNSSGEMINDNTVPANVTFVNGSTDPTNNLRQQMLTSGTAAGTTNPNGWLQDITFTFTKNTLDDGSLSSAMGLGANPDQILSLNFDASQYGSSNFEITGAPTNDGYATGVLTSMSVDENESVTTNPFGIGGIVAKVSCPKSHGNIGHTHRHTRMPRLCLLNSVHRKRTDGISHQLRSHATSHNVPTKLKRQIQRPDRHIFIRLKQ